MTCDTWVMCSDHDMWYYTSPKSRDRGGKWKTRKNKLKEKGKGNRKEKYSPLFLILT